MKLHLNEEAEQQNKVSTTETENIEKVEPEKFYTNATEQEEADCEANEKEAEKGAKETVKELKKAEDNFLKGNLQREPNGIKPKMPSKPRGMFEKLTLEEPSEVLTEDVDSPMVDMEAVTRVTDITSIISGLIKDEWESIDNYNGALIALQAVENNDAYADVLREIQSEEYVHVGQLEAILQKMIPAAAGIEEGPQEVEEITNGQEPVAVEVTEIPVEEEVEEQLHEDLPQDDTEEIDYNGYSITYNFYDQGEYTVQYDGDDVWFDSLEEAQGFIDELNGQEKYNPLEDPIANQEYTLPPDDIEA